MLKVKKLSAEKLQSVRAGMKANCWEPGAGCDCRDSGTVFADPFDLWLVVMQLSNPE